MEDTSGESTPNSEQSEQTPTETPTEQMTPAELRKYKVKVDGEEMEVDENELLTNYQLRKASDKRFSEAMQARKQSEEFIKMLKTDPAKVLSHPSLGLDAKKWAEEYLISEMKKEMMTPEQRELSEYKEKLAKYQEQEELTKKQKDEADQLAVQQKYQDDYNKQIVEALETSGLPKTEYTVQRMIYYMAKALESDYELSAKDVTELVKKDYQKDTQALYSNLDADALIKILGDDITKKIRKHDIDKVKQFKPGSVPAMNTSNQSSTPTNQDTKMDKTAWRKMIEEIE